MRLEQKKGFGNCTIINDSYNSDFHSLSIALDFLNQQQQHPVKTLILSDILQSGKDEKVLYMEVANLIKNKKINKFIGIGTSLFKYSDLFIGASRFFKTTEEFLKSFPRQSFQNEAILIKGSRKFEFEKISSLLEQKTHRTILEINLNAMIANLNYFKRKLNPSTKIMAMVKALSYGSGSYEIANMLEFQKTDYLAVAFADEGVALRQAGIGLPIVVMNPEEGNYELMIDYHLEMEVYSFRELLLITNALKALRVSNFPVHLKLNTGMNRLGFDHDEIDELIHNLEKNESIKVMSIFSHMAASDEKEHDDFTRLQIRRFDEMSLKLISALGYPVLRHILNSSGIERFPSAQYDMVRLGIGLYGVGCDENKNALQSVSNLKSYISQIRKVPANETVGYSRNGKTDQEISVGIVPIGYADGYSRRMGNGVGRMYVNGAYAPVVGNICMDMCMINLTGLNVQEGDKVIIFGEKIPISEISEKMQTNPYEILTGISQRVKRVYFQE
jgi:alanine racemase